MKDPHIRIEADQLNPQEQSIPEHAIAKAAQGIKWRARRASAAHGKPKAIPLQQAAKATKIHGCRRTLQSPQLIDVQSLA
jgi:hypothetical protein